MTEVHNKVHYLPKIVNEIYALYSSVHVLVIFSKLHVSVLYYCIVHVCMTLLSSSVDGAIALHNASSKRY